MADATITQLTNYTNPQPTDVLPIVDVANNITKKIAYSLLASLGNNNIWTGTNTFSPLARTSGFSPYFTINAPADVGITANAEAIGINIAGSTRTWLDGSVSTQSEYFFGAPTYNKTVTSASFTTASTLVVSGPPVAGTGVTITNPYAFYVQSGNFHLGGALGGTTQGGVGGTGGEITDSNNTPGGHGLIIGNVNPGTHAYSAATLVNDLANDNTYTHFAGIFLNSNEYTDTSFGTAFSIINQFAVYGTDGPTVIGTLATGVNAYVNFVVGGNAVANESGRFTTSGLTVGLTGTLTGAIKFSGGTSTGITVQGVAAGLSGVNTLQAVTDTFVYRATTDTFTNKTYDTAGTGNVFKINGTQITANTGTGSNVLATSPTLITPVLGVATATSINGNTITSGTGTLTLSTFTLTIANMASVSGTNTGDQTTISGNAGTATALQNARTLWGQSFDGTANISGSLTAVANITGGASSMTITAGTGNSRTLALQSTTSGGTATTFLTGNADQTVTFAAGITVAGTLALSANSITMTGSLAATGARVTKGWFTDLESTNMITINGTSLTTVSQTFQNKTITNSNNTLGGVTMGLGSDAVGDIYAATTSNVLSRIAAVAVGQVFISKGTTTLPAWSASVTISQMILTANAITASSNAATVPVTSGRNIVTNNSAAGLTITMATSGAVSMQTCMVQILPSSAVAQVLTFVGTENSAITSVPANTGSSTTIPISVGFIYNAATSKWTCVASS